MDSKVNLIGYSGHAYVICDIFELNRVTVVGYYDKEEKEINPFNLKFLGSEDVLSEKGKVMISIGNNNIRKNIAMKLSYDIEYVNAIHPNAFIAKSVQMGEGIMIGPNSTINSLVTIGAHVIINSGAIVEHECNIESFSHIASGAVLAGNVTIGESTFIGANAVIKQNVIIGNNVTVGAGAVVLHDIPNGKTAVGNPAKIIKRKQIKV